jgi:hypothetical protein
MGVNSHLDNPKSFFYSERLKKRTRLQDFTGDCCEQLFSFDD